MVRKTARMCKRVCVLVSFQRFYSRSPALARPPPPPQHPSPLPPSLSSPRASLALRSSFPLREFLTLSNTAALLHCLRREPSFWSTPPARAHSSGLPLRRERAPLQSAPDVAHPQRIQPVLSGRTETNHQPRAGGVRRAGSVFLRKILRRERVCFRT